MAEKQASLSVYGSVTLDSSGDGTIDFGVDNAWQRWEIDSVRVSTSQGADATPFPTAEVFAGPISPGFSQGATWTGNSDTFSGNCEIEDGDELHVVFTGGIADSKAYARVYGRKYTRIS